jgi:microcystin-dependent protein
MAKKAYVNDGNDWVELASATTDLTGYATETYVDTSISNLVDTAPTALNTLNELAAALGDDANFASTITSLIADKISNVPGMISQYGGATAPTGWFLCEGQEVSISTYTNLYNALTSTGSVFPYGANTNGSGGVGSTHFRLPNLKGRIPVGKDSAQTEFDALGETGGAKTHTLTSAEIPAHSHPNTATFAGSAGTTGNDSPDHAHGPGSSNFALWTGGVVGLAGGGILAPSGMSITSSTAGANARHQHGFTPAGTVTITNNNNTGGGGAHNNLQPYVVINYIIRY